MDDAAFALELERALPALQVRARRLSRQYDDLIQNTMLRAWRSRGMYTQRHSRPLLAWLFVIMRRAHIDMRRTALLKINCGMQASVMDAWNPPAPVPDEPPDEKLIQRIRRALPSLPRQHRRLVDLLFFEGRSMRETAAAMGYTENGAKSCYRRALACLRDAMRYESQVHGPRQTIPNL